MTSAHLLNIKMRLPEGTSIKPILFSTPMVQAILDGTKTQTRRVVKSRPHNSLHLLTIRNSQLQWDNKPCPYGKPGDILWVREKWLFQRSPYRGYVYAAEFSEALIKTQKWKPSIHMPFEVARIFLRIKSVRVERLKDISEEDAISEGCCLYGPFGEYKGVLHPNGGSMKYRAYSKATRAFECLWESINGDESWNANPWVWVVEFEIAHFPTILKSY